MQLKSQIYIDSKSIEKYLIFLAKEDMGCEFEDIYNQLYGLRSTGEAVRVLFYIRSALGLPDMRPAIY